MTYLIVMRAKRRDGKPAAWMLTRSPGFESQDEAQEKIGQLRSMLPDHEFAIAQILEETDVERAAG